MPTLEIDGIAFHYLDEGKGLPFFFQHGLGGDVGQPAGLFKPPPGVRFLSFDFRAHGCTLPLGDPEKLAMASFADDLLGIMDRLEIEAAVVGGISLGAAVALNFVLRHPGRALGLVLSRPAWLEGPNERNARVYAFIAQLLRQHGASDGLRLFQASNTYADMLRESPDAAASLVGQFENPRALEAVPRLERLPRDAPLRQLPELQAISVPTLILANYQDPIHPFVYGEVLSRRIPGARMEILTPKSVSKESHASDVNRCLCNFLEKQFLTTTAQKEKTAC